MQTDFQTHFIIWKSSYFDSSVFPGGSDDDKPSLVQVLAWRNTSNFLNQRWSSLLAHVYASLGGLDESTNDLVANR